MFYNSLESNIENWFLKLPDIALLIVDTYTTNIYYHAIYLIYIHKVSNTTFQKGRTYDHLIVREAELFISKIVHNACLLLHVICNSLSEKGSKTKEEGSRDNKK